MALNTFRNETEILDIESNNHNQENFKTMFSLSKNKDQSCYSIHEWSANISLDYQNPPFTNTGVNFLGPIFIKQQRSRLKRWSCLFACMVTRAIHLELVESLDSDSFINTLLKFINRRGSPNTNVSDCGSNFKGAAQELKLEFSGLKQEKIAIFKLKQNIKWRFTPRSAPHMGCSWERLIQVGKALMFNIINERVLTDCQIMTFFTEVETIGNNRPLTANSD